MIAQRVHRVTENASARQFIKFCIVGATSTIIDFSVLHVLHNVLHRSLFEAISLAFLCGVTNGFFWNRRWTFKEGAQNVRSQYPKFVATNVVGYTLNIAIMATALWLAARWGLLAVQRSFPETVSLMLDLKSRDMFPPLAVNLAKAVATVFVVAWNFTASKFWTFKTTDAPDRNVS